MFTIDYHRIVTSESTLSYVRHYECDEQCLSKMVRRTRTLYNVKRLCTSCYDRLQIANTVL